jgi:quercetin dioxygenase-like cupin family protein
MEIRNEESFNLNEGEYFIVNRGTEHRVYSEEECWIMLVEPKVTKHTGSVQSKITRSVDEQLNN